MSFFINLPSVMFLCRAKIILLLYLVALFPSAGYAGKDKKVDSYRTISFKPCTWKNRDMSEGNDEDNREYYFCDRKEIFHLKAKEKVRISSPCKPCKGRHGIECFLSNMGLTQVSKQGDPVPFRRGHKNLYLSLSSGSYFVSNHSSENMWAMISAIHCARGKKIITVNKNNLVE